MKVDPADQVVAPLPIAVPPLPAETLPSWFDRLSSDMGRPLNLTMARVGMIDEDHHRQLPVGYGITLDAIRLQRLAQATDQPVARIESLLLSSYDGGPVDLRGLSEGDTLAISVVAGREWLYVNGSHCCPGCLRDNGGAWLLPWRLPWSFACVRHGTILVDQCPRCGSRTASGRRDGSLAPAFASFVPRPGFCNNPLRDGAALSGRSAAPCGFDLRHADTEWLSSAAVLDVQRRLDGAIDGRLPKGYRNKPRDWWSDLRAVAAAALAALDVDEVERLVEDLPAVSSEEYAAHVELREAKQADRERVKRGGRDHRQGGRFRTYRGAPTSAGVMLAVASIAVGVVADHDDDALRLIGKVTRRRLRHSLPARLRNYYHATPQLVERAQAATVTRFVDTARLSSRRGGRQFEPQHVPQLIWQEDWDRSFASLFTGTGTRDVTARRFCSMAVVQRVVDWSWGEIGESLGYPASTSRGIANALPGRLRRVGNLADFHRTIDGVADHLGADGSVLIDFAARRYALRNFRLLPESLARRLVVDGRPVMVTDALRRNAAAWVWQYLTIGDVALAPAFDRGSREGQLEVYRRFLRRVVSSAEPQLIEQARAILGDVLDPKHRRPSH